MTDADRDRARVENLILARQVKLQMYKRYLDMNEDDVADAFGTSQIDKRIDKQERVARHK